MLAEACGKVFSMKTGKKSIKTAVSLSNVIDVDHQNCHLFTNKGQFPLLLSPYYTMRWVCVCEQKREKNVRKTQLARVLCNIEIFSCVFLALGNFLGVFSPFCLYQKRKKKSEVK